MTEDELQQLDRLVRGEVSEGFYYAHFKPLIKELRRLQATEKRPSEHERLRNAVIEAAKTVRDLNVKWEEDTEGDCSAENMPDDLVEACIELCEAYDNLEACERKAGGQ